VATIRRATFSVPRQWTSSQAPTVDLGTGLSPGAGAITITGFVPSVTLGTTVTPGAGALTITGFAPSVTIGTSAITVTPDTGTITFTGYPPTVSGIVVPSITPSGIAADAGSFGKWYNLAYSNRPTRRRGTRTSALGVELDRLAYADEDALLDQGPEEREEAAELVRLAAEAIEARGDEVATPKEARGLVEAYLDSYRVVVNLPAEISERRFLSELRNEAEQRYKEAQRRQALSRRDEDDLMMLAMMQ
jgi:hypothetical protein